MTPFGEAMHALRQKKGVSQKQMAQAIGVSAAYLSALEHGKRGTPSFEFLQRVAGFFNVIWDEADELFRLAKLSDPRVTIDTGGLPAVHIAFANRLRTEIRDLPTDTVEAMADILEKSRFADREQR